MRNLNEDTITQAVIERFSKTPDPRLKEILSSLIQHLHAFAREVQITEEEWLRGIDFLTRTGQKCDDKRQEFILLSDTLGLSMLTVAMNNKKPAGCTEATVFGPFYVEGAPSYQNGFRDGDQYLDSDVVFGVRQSLVASWKPQANGDHLLEFDFVLNPLK
jgi:hydroxyquinol 1,2-dioxygenase